MAEMRTALGVPVTVSDAKKHGPVSAWFVEVWDGFYTTLIGMGVTWKHFFRKPITVQYPHQNLNIPERSRQRVHVDIDLCMGCMACERVCPAGVISITTAKPIAGEDLGLRPNGKKRPLHLAEFTLDHSKCLYCGLCETVCNDDSIYMIQDFHFSTNSRADLFVNYSRYTAADRDRVVAAAAAEKAAKAAAPKPPPPAPKPVVAAPAAEAPATPVETPAPAAANTDPAPAPEGEAS